MILFAYLLGSIPSAVWIGKKYYGVDIREHGSRNAGTTNMLRVLGRRAAVPVFALDFLKGFVAVTLIALLKYDEHVGDIWIINLKIVAVFAAVLGHIFPVFAGFRGGKGVATLVGAVTGIYPPAALLCFGVWSVVLMISHYVSLSSMIAGCCFPVFTLISPKVNGDFDTLLDEGDIDTILRGQGNYADEVQKLVERETAAFASDLFSALRERMIDLHSGQVVFIGGGSILLRRFIEQSGKVGHALLVDDIKANARGYEILYQGDAARR